MVKYILTNRSHLLLLHKHHTKKGKNTRGAPRTSKYFYILLYTYTAVANLPSEAHHPWSEARLVGDVIERLLLDGSVLVDSLRPPRFLYTAVHISSKHQPAVSVCCRRTFGV